MQFAPKLREVREIPGPCRGDGKRRGAEEDEEGGEWEENEHEKHRGVDLFDANKNGRTESSGEMLLSTGYLEVCYGPFITVMLLGTTLSPKTDTKCMIGAWNVA